MTNGASTVRQGVILMRIPNSLKQFGIEQAVDYITRDPEKNLPTLMSWPCLNPG